MTKTEPDASIKPAESGESVPEAVHEEIEIEAKELSEEEIAKQTRKKAADDVREAWHPRTDLGRKVKSGAVTNIDQILDRGLPIFESEIVDVLVPNMENDLLMIGQAKGKFGGGQRRIFRQTQKKTAEGNKPNFATCAVVGNRDGYVGVGYGKSKETVPARDKAIRKAKLNIKKIRRGCGSWQCGCREPHSVPYAVEGRCGSIRLKLMPAPKGKGLVVQKEIQKILRLAGIRDIWSRASGDTRTTLNMIHACVNALNTLVETKIKEEHRESLSICDGMRQEAQHG